MSDQDKREEQPAGQADERLKALEAENQALRDELYFFRSLVDDLPQNIYRKDREGRCTYANRAFLETVGQSLEQALGKTAHDYYPPDLAAKYDLDDQAVMDLRERIELVEEHVAPTAGDKTYVRVIKAPVYTESGEVVGTQGIFWDVTASQRVQKLSEQVERQAAALSEVGTPLMPISEGVLVMPLVGSIDRARADRVLETLLSGVTEQHAFVAILDVTGVTTLDDEVANSLMQVAHAVGLLGADVVLTGMRPAMAQSLVTMGADLKGIVTRATLKDGVSHALKRRASMNSRRAIR